MPAVRADILVQGGSYEPLYWTITDPVTAVPIDLTAPGFLVTGAVATRLDGTGVKLLDLVDGEVWHRTANGRVYFQPSSAASKGWGIVHGYYQADLTHPSGQTVRIAEGRFAVDFSLI